MRRYSLFISRFGEHDVMRKQDYEEFVVAPLNAELRGLARVFPWPEIQFTIDNTDNRFFEKADNREIQDKIAFPLVPSHDVREQKRADHAKRMEAMKKWLWVRIVTDTDNDRLPLNERFQSFNREREYLKLSDVHEALISAYGFEFVETAVER